MRREARRVLVGAAAGAIVGALGAVIYARLDEKRSIRAGVVRGESAPLNMGQVTTVAVHVVNVLRQILSLA